MQIKDFSNKMTSEQLNESLAKQFGYKLNLTKFNESQLKQAHTNLANKVIRFESSNSFDSVLENHEYQKTRAMLDVVAKALQERTLTPSETKKKEKFVKGMKSKSSEFKKRYGERGEEVMHATATKMAKSESLDEALGILRNVLSERVLSEGEEEKAALIMSARDMVDRVTGWLEDIASMKAEAMLELVDSIRDELGSEVSQPFNDLVKPTLEDLYTGLETARTKLAQAVSIVTGEEGPEDAAGAIGAAPTTGTNLLEPTSDEFGAAAAATGGVEAAGREKRESIDFSRKLGTILSSKKK